MKDISTKIVGFGIALLTLLPLSLDAQKPKPNHPGKDEYSKYCNFGEGKHYNKNVYHKSIIGKPVFLFNGDAMRYAKKVNNKGDRDDCVREQEKRLNRYFHNKGK